MVGSWEFLVLAGVVLVLLLLLILTYVYKSNDGIDKKKKPFPPGPKGFPILGHLPLLGMKPYLKATNWKAKYGPIIGLKLGMLRCVIISDYKLIKEAMNEPSFAGRPKLQIMTERSDGEIEGVAFTEGKKWQELRRFTLRRLRDLGFRTKSMESVVQEEIQELIERFKETVGTPIDTRNRFNATVINALWQIMTGERFKHDDPELIKIIDCLTSHIKGGSTLSVLLTFFPTIAKLVPKSVKVKMDTGLSMMFTVIEFVKPVLEKHVEMHEPGQPKDLIDTFLDEIKKTSASGGSTSNSNLHVSKSINSVLFTLMDLFMAGSETTSTTLTWIFLYMARNQHVQVKLAEEIHRVVGTSRIPSLNDRSQMPYTEAVIHEVLRVSSIAPLSVMRSAMEDVHFHNYFIPKGTFILSNLYEMHHNIGIWGDPENFRPERFLNKDETQFVRHEELLPFGSGKRVCLGESLARDELFLFTSSLFQVFHVDIDKSDGQPAPTYEAGGSDVRIPKPHKLVLSLRN